MAGETAPKSNNINRLHGISTYSDCGWCDSLTWPYFYSQICNEEKNIGKNVMNILLKLFSPSTKLFICAIW